MAELSLEDKCKAAAKLIEQSPPGEVNDVINDIRSIINDDETLMIHVQPALRSHNLAQLHVVEHPATDNAPAHSSLLSEAAILPGSEEERYVDPEAKQSFAFDHVQLTSSDYQPYNLPEEDEAFRAELAKSLKSYVKNHFSTGISSVTTSQYPLLPSQAEVAAPETTATSTEPETEAQTEAPVEGKAEETDEPVTDVVDEQVGSGEVEPVPTPAAGGEADHPAAEEVTEKGGIEQVDEGLEELKVEDEAEKPVPETSAGTPEDGQEAGQEAKDSQSATPQVTEEETKIDTEAVDQMPVATAAPEAKKQEKVENPTFTLETVGNKYNTGNFWTGRWRTCWIVDKAAGQVSGTIHVDVHYFEQGNVQLATKHTSSFPCPIEPTGSQSIASQIVTTISKIETSYQLELNDVYGDLGDKAFRSLRRALPVTRQKMDWEKVGGYSLGSDLTKARG